jgi:molybdate transport system substrate-binding protein
LENLPTSASLFSLSDWYLATLVTNFYWRFLRMKFTIKTVTALFCLLLVTTPALAGDVNLSVAASLKEVINELSDGFAKTHPGVKFVKNYGASGQLAKQIENGAPSDIFISANLEWMDYLKNKHLADNASIGTFTYNTLVFAGAPGKASSLHDLLKLDRIAIGSPKSVPAGEYAMEAFKRAGLEKQLEKKLIMAKDVRECLMYSERGEVDGAFVYRTDALQAKQAKILFTVPQELYPRVIYPLSLTVSGAKSKDAVTFFSYLHGNEAKAVLAKYGFASR